jgi:hypothetical protein
MSVIPASRSPVFLAAMASMDTPPRRRMATGCRRGRRRPTRRSYREGPRGAPVGPERVRLGDLERMGPLTPESDRPEKDELTPARPPGSAPGSARDTGSARHRRGPEKMN